jgi:hypothetical protein
MKELELGTCSYYELVSERKESAEDPSKKQTAFILSWDELFSYIL